MENRELNFPEKEFVRKNTKLEPVTGHQARKYRNLLTKEAEKETSKGLPGSFGKIMDGWKHNSTHYVGVFATYPGSMQHGSGSQGEQGKQVLLAMSPLLYEERMDAASHSDFIKATFLERL